MSKFEKQNRKEPKTFDCGLFYGDVTVEESNQLHRDAMYKVDVQVLSNPDQNRERIIDDVRLAEYVRRHHPEIVIEEQHAETEQSETVRVWVDKPSDVAQMASDCIDLAIEKQVRIELIKSPRYVFSSGPGEWVFDPDTDGVPGLQDGESLEEAVHNFMGTPHEDR